MYKMFQEDIDIRNTNMTDVSNYGKVYMWHMYTIIDPKGAHVAFFSNKRLAENFVELMNR